MRIEFLFIGLTILILCLSVANSLEMFFDFGSNEMETLRTAFLVLGLGSFITGAIKGIGG